MRRVAVFSGKYAILPYGADVDQTTVDLLEEIWRTCGVLIFRRQALSEDEPIAFAALYTTFTV